MFYHWYKRSIKLIQMFYHKIQMFYFYIYSDTNVLSQIQMFYHTNKCSITQTNVLSQSTNVLSHKQMFYHTLQMLETSRFPHSNRFYFFAFKLNKTLRGLLLVQFQTCLASTVEDFLQQTNLPKPPSSITDARPNNLTRSLK